MGKHWTQQRSSVCESLGTQMNETLQYQELEAAGIMLQWWGGGGDVEIDTTKRYDVLTACHAQTGKNKE